VKKSEWFLPYFHGFLSIQNVKAIALNIFSALVYDSEESRKKHGCFNLKIKKEKFSVEIQ